MLNLLNHQRMIKEGDTLTQKIYKDENEKGFHIICKNCGSEDFEFSCYSGEYASDVLIKCNECHNQTAYLC